MKKLLALLLALVMVLSLCACGKSGKDKEDKESTPEDAVKNLVAFTFEGKASKLKSLAPKEFWDYIEEEEGETLSDLQQEYEEVWADREESYEEEYGSGFKASYEILEKDEIDEDVLERIAEWLDDEYGIDADSVKKGYDMTLELTLKGSEEEETDEAEIAVIQIGDEWYPISYYDDGYDCSYVNFLM